MLQIAEKAELEQNSDENKDDDWYQEPLQ